MIFESPSFLRITPWLLAPALTACCLFASEQGPADSLRIAFQSDRAVVSGVVPTEEDIAAITTMIQEARPGLKVDHADLQAAPGAPILNAADLDRLLTEIALSTNEGHMTLSPTHLDIGGMTDSVLARSVLRLRAKPFLKGRSLIDHICIVTSDELPSINVALATGKSVPAIVAPSTDPTVPPPTPEVPFETPGIRLESLLSTLSLFGQIDHLAGRTPATAVSLRAVPLKAAESPPPTDEVSLPSEPQAPVPTGPTVEAVSSVYFARNSFFLQVNQEGVFNDLAKRVLAQGSSGVTIAVQTLTPPTGSAVLNEYLTERRNEEVLKFLGELGISSERILTRTLPSSSNFDTGEVRISLIIPPSAPVTNPKVNEQTTEISAQSVPLSSGEVAR